MSRISHSFIGAAMLLVASAAPSLAAPTCNLGNGIKHVVYLQFDNVHLRRDIPNVPSDLEQIPSLLNFLRGQGTLLTNHHTPLISHTSVDIVTALSGVYGEHFGFGVGNSFGFLDPGGVPHFQSSFAYWTDLVNENPSGTALLVPELVDQRGLIHPAPWVPFTRAGCDVGAFSIANIELENANTNPTGDLATVFGNPSPEFAEAGTNGTLAAADFEGIAIHCAKNSALCAASTHAVADVLNDEPQPNGTGTGGYAGYKALFGNKYVAPAINHGNPCVTDLFGQPITDGVAPPHGPNCGLPAGFDPAPQQSLGYAAQMLEAGVPVVYLYIEDAHDNHHFAGAPLPNDSDGAFGPGEADYVYQLQVYNQAFAAFFARLAHDGITKDNTLFVVTADENDHPALGLPPSPVNCDGIHVPCIYTRKGEIDADLSEVYFAEFNNSTPFSVHSDDAPTFYVNGNLPQTSTTVRTLEQQAAEMLGFDDDAGTNGETNKVAQALADRTEERLLHMLSHDPARSPDFTLFGNPDYFLFASSHHTTACSPVSNVAGGCFAFPGPSFVWNHGDFQNDITHTWLGIVGPGVQQNGEFGAVFSDHTDIRPTILALTKLKDDYAHDGRVLFEVLSERALPDSLRDHRNTLARLAEAYKQINAPRGELGRRTLTGMSTRALGASNAAIYSRLENRLANITEQRNGLAAQMIAMLEAAAFDNKAIDERLAKNLIDQANDLLESLNE
ncbi:MAG: hypothetical protein JO254_15415 [Pseudolabrys sp.]|nr:hypothetical protein [Pseudolabrys sp.]